MAAIAASSLRRGSCAPRASAAAGQLPSVRLRPALPTIVPARRTSALNPHLVVQRAPQQRAAQSRRQVRPPPPPPLPPPDPSRRAHARRARPRGRQRSAARWRRRRQQWRAAAQARRAGLLRPHALPALHNRLHTREHIRAARSGGLRVRCVPAHVQPRADTGAAVAGVVGAQHHRVAPSGARLRGGRRPGARAWRVCPRRACPRGRCRPSDAASCT